jgi:hypothetical protein
MSDPLETYMMFDGLNAPLRVLQADIVRPVLAPVLAAWPHHETSDADKKVAPPFATVAPAKDGRWMLEAPLAASSTSFHDPIDAICDLLVEMSWERLRSRPDLLCLHAAAIGFGDRLVIFPNTRRAGKSLLSATLAQLGHPVFSDDFVPLAFNPESREISGIANGIAPRLRLPLPPQLPTNLSDWIGARIGPTNKRYGYLTGIDLPNSGTAAPIGAVVLLDRDDGKTGSACLEPISRDEAIAALVTQNFARQVHAGAILSVIAAISQAVPLFRLSYSDVSNAAELLHRNPELTNLPAATIPPGNSPSTDRPAPLDSENNPDLSEFDHRQYHTRLPGYVEVVTEEALYLADAQGWAIHRLNQGSMLIWKLLNEPMSGLELAELMRDIFPDIPHQRLLADAIEALKFLWSHQLIVVQSGTLTSGGFVAQIASRGFTV